MRQKRLIDSQRISYPASWRGVVISRRIRTEHRPRRTPAFRPEFFFSLLPALCAALLFSLTSCATSRAETEPQDFVPEILWREVADGISRCDFHDPQSGTEWHAVRIELDTPGLSVECAPESSGWQKAVSVRALAAEKGAAVALNTVPFHRRSKCLPGSKVRPAGLLVNRGKIIAGPNPRYCALVLRRTEDGDFSARILDSQADFTPDCAEYAFGGFWTILRDGEIRTFRPVRDFRTGAGVAEGGRILLLMAGGKFTYGECARIFAALGAETAMQLDGGSSSALVIGGRDVLRVPFRRKVSAAACFSARGAERAAENPQ